MTKARILADYVAGGTTAAEFDVLDGLTSTTAELNQLDTTSGTPSATTFLRGDKTWQAAGGLALSGMTVLTVGSGNYTKPLNVTALHIIATGAGAGGASGGDNWNNGGGGAGGATVITFKTGLPTAATDYAYVVGAKGAGAAAGNNLDGSAGGESTLAIDSIFAGGGAAGQGGASFQVAAGGTATGGVSGSVILIRGGMGGTSSGGKYDDETAAGIQGGGSYWGSGASAGFVSDAPDAYTYGTGGGGGDQNLDTDKAGGDGMDGVIVIYEYS